MPLPRAIGRLNKVVTNPVARVVAGRLPGFGIITHVGRRSGREYHTPVNVFRRSGGFVVALTYGGGDWVENVLAAGEAELRTRGDTIHLDNPRTVTDPGRAGIPALVRAILGRLHVDTFLWLDVSSVQSISAITLLTGDMREAVAFYRALGLHLLYGGPDAAFTSFRIGAGYLNLQHDPARSRPGALWGRVVLWVDDVDAMHQRALEAGFVPETAPTDAPWGERYFHIRDPDGHELSFARPLASR
jgi:deazaflavin-dependent oxidoreductase (nitroreductase family)